MVGKHAGGLVIDIAAQGIGIIDNKRFKLTPFTYFIGVKNDTGFSGLERIGKRFALKRLTLDANHQDGRGKRFFGIGGEQVQVILVTWLLRDELCLTHDDNLVLGEGGILLAGTDYLTNIGRVTIEE